MPDGHTDRFTYNGLGLRVGKTDSTGTYSYVCDGTTPGSPVLSDGHALYTPGLSENRGGASAYYSNDRLGNLWTLDGSSKNPLTYADFNGFGQTTAGSLGSTPFGFGGGNGCQTEVDTGLVLMGHRYYDTRIGRFLSQDPIGDGDNWYAYCDNDPMNGVDPSGLQLEGSSPMGSPGYLGINSGAQADADMGFLEDYSEKTYTHTWQEVFKFSADPSGGGSYKDTGNEVPGSDTWTEQGGMTRFAADSSLDGTPTDVQLTRELAAADDGTAGTLQQPKGWGRGTYNSAKDCAKDHFERKGSSVNAKTYEEYLRKAEGFNQNLKRATVKTLENGCTRFTKSGQYIIKDIENLIVSFGKAR